ncbi:DNA-processing protein DprA [Deinobacterium chartae]|uniref:DNA-processing protein DprA n=1 Tax=Deinobacterium chartae TaxID=521158 RepID=UPI00160930D6|nr:DNA-processing protein DprA [Deinobacterium chartae]
MTPEAQGELRALLALRFTPGLGPRRIAALQQAFGSAQQALAARRDALSEVEGLDSRVLAEIGRASHTERADLELERARRVGVTLLGAGQPGYPTALRALPDPPAVLWARGELPPLEVVPRAVGVVGTRAASPFGLEFTRTLARDLARAAVVVVSGLARGIDTAAHAACLEAGGVTLGVLGCGVDRVYPAENRALAARMTVLSEHPLGTAPAAHHFPGRNRIIAALSAGSVIVEGSVTSGAMHTAMAALECGRTVFAVPGRAGDPLAQGPHRLLREGAVLTESVADVLAELGWGEVKTDAPELEGERRAVYAALEGPALLDEVARRCGLDAVAVQGLLMLLCLEGHVRELPGGRYARA